MATDVAARGLDIHGITHVVNYDIPNCSDDYIHRIGRTGRARAEGDAITFVCPDDHQALGTIERALGANLPRPRLGGRGAVRSGFCPEGKRGAGNRRPGSVEVAGGVAASGQWAAAYRARPSGERGAFAAVAMVSG